MDKTVRENNNGKYLTVYSHEFKEAIEFAVKNKLEQIQIRGVIGKENIDTVVDFKEIEKISPYLRVLSFGDSVDNNIVNFDSIYSLNKLEKLYINCKQNFLIDISQYKKPEHLGTEYWNGLKNIGKTKTLKSLVITKYPDDNLNEILELTNLKILHIYSSKIKTLEGIEILSNLEELSLSRNNCLENINGIEKLKLLNRLDIEKCKKITDFKLKTESESEKLLRTRSRAQRF